MKLIEAMKRVKANKEKIEELQRMISLNCANLTHETPVYGADTKGKVMEWVQSCTDLSQENVRLLCAIQKTNLNTFISIELGGKQVTKCIAEWVWRRREYANLDLKSWSTLSDRNLKEGVINSSIGTPIEVKIIRHFEPEKRDNMKMMYKDEPSKIDASLEIANAVTDLIE